jgi:hypothetical protein
MQSVEKHQDIPKEDAVVKPVKGQKKQQGDVESQRN